MYINIYKKIWFLKYNPTLWHLVLVGHEEQAFIDHVLKLKARLVGTHLNHLVRLYGVGYHYLVDLDDEVYVVLPGLILELRLRGPELLLNRVD